MKSIILILALFTVISLQQKIMGGWQDQNVKQFLSDNSNKKAYNAAVQAALSQAGKKYILLKVYGIRTQIVAGQNTEFDLILKQQGLPQQQSQQNQSKKKYYKVVVFEQVWTNTLKVISVNEVLQP